MPEDAISLKLISLNKYKAEWCGLCFAVVVIRQILKYIADDGQSLQHWIALLSFGSMSNNTHNIAKS